MNDKEQKIFFYTTFGCHLCEKVEAMLIEISHQFRDKFHYQIVAFDIIDDDKIFEQYRYSIPVLKKEKDGDELGWPFDYQQLCDWLDLN